jgi:hypothetical protein
MARVVTRHFLRRRARAKARELAATTRWHPGGGGVPTFRVVPAQHGPYRWLVVRD